MEPDDKEAEPNPSETIAVSPRRRVAVSLFAGVSPSVVIIGFASLFSDISGEMIYPILPLF